jgi:ectoine hydroxylase-related dioxygenase (phytanoyl-CoA dioxygenase family)
MPLSERVRKLASHLSHEKNHLEERRGTSSITTADKRQLDEQGYLVIENFFDAHFREKLSKRLEQLYAEEGESAGSEFRQEPGSRRLANLVNKDGDDRLFQHMISHPKLLPYVAHILGAGDFKLSSLNARSTTPGKSDQTGQPLHADTAAVPDEKGNWVCNVMWLVDEYTAENGPLRLVPASHLKRKLPADEMDDPKAPHHDEVHLIGKPGTIFIINAHCWHGGMPNFSPKHRTSVHTFFCRRDKPQQQYQKSLLQAEVQLSLQPLLRWILALDDTENDIISAEGSGASGFMK